MTDLNQKKKNYLMQYRQLTIAEKMLWEQYYALDDDFMLPKSPRYDGMPHAHNAEHDLSDYSASRDEIYREIRAAAENRMARRRDITERIEQMESEAEKNILYFRYIQGLTFEEISVKMSYSYRHVRRLHGSALTHFPIKDVLLCPPASVV